MPQSTNLSRIHHGDLVYAVGRLIAAKKTNLAEIRRLAADRSVRINSLERELRALRAGQTPTSRPGPGRRSAAPRRATKRKRKFTMTPKARAARKLQGQYLGLLRNLEGANRTKVKALAQKKSVAAAVKLARKLAK